MKKTIWLPLLLVSLISLSAILIFGLTYESRKAKTEPEEFDSYRAYQDVIAQVEFGPRIPGSPAHSKTINYIQSELNEYGWETEIQETEYQNQQIKNIIAKRGSGKPLLFLGAHYDSRIAADQDRDIDMQNQPVPGANDGASGVAVLLELGRVLPSEINGQIWLVFFDAEDQGNLAGWDWILGSRAFVNNLEEIPDAVVIIDMIGDSNLNIYLEKNSNVGLREEIWYVANQLGYDQFFIPEEKYSILDDHTPFLEKGIAAIDIIDFSYPFWHTSQDTSDKVSPESLKTVGDTLLAWLYPKVMVGKN